MRKIGLFVSIIVLSGCVSMEHEIDIELSELPDNIYQAALDAVPGFVVESAEIEMEDGTKIYELEGTANGEEIEIEIDEAGKVIEVEN